MLNSIIFCLKGKDVKDTDFIQHLFLFKLLFKIKSVYTFIILPVLLLLLWLLLLQTSQQESELQP